MEREISAHRRQKSQRQHFQVAFAATGHIQSIPDQPKLLKSDCYKKVYSQKYTEAKISQSRSTLFSILAFGSQNAWWVAFSIGFITLRAGG